MGGAADIGPEQRPAVGGWPTAWIVVWLALVFVGIDVIWDPTLYDKTLLSRLHALAVALLVAIPALVLPRVVHRLDVGVLREPVVLCAIASTVCAAASLLVAVNPSLGLLDLVRTWSFTLVLIVSALLLPLLPRWSEHVLRLFVASTMVTAGCGWYELVSKHGLGMHPRLAIEDVSGRMCTINLLSNYLVFVWPGCLAAACLLRGPWRPAAMVSAIASLVLVVLLQSRSAYLALAAGTVVALVGAWRWRDRLGLGPRFRSLVVTGAVGLACGAPVLVVLAGPDHPIVARLRSIGEARRPDGAPADGGRIMIWRLTGRLIADHPFVGVGAGNFPIRISEYYAAPEADMTGLPTDEWSRPHNDLLQTWAEKGVFGLAAFVGMFLSAFAAIRTIVRRAAVRDARLAVFMLMAIASHLVTSCFDFPLERVSHQATLAVLLATLTVLKRQSLPTSAPSCASGGWNVWLARSAFGGMALSVVPCVAWTTIAIDQERTLLDARKALAEGRLHETIRLARRGTTPWRTLDPFNRPVAFVEGVALMRLGELDAAITCLERARRDHPNQMAVLTNLGILYAMAGRMDDALDCFMSCVRRYPHRHEGVTNLAALYLDTGRPGDTIELLEQVPEARRTVVMKNHLERARAMITGATTSLGEVPSD